MLNKFAQPSLDIHMHSILERHPLKLEFYFGLQAPRGCVVCSVLVTHQAHLVLVIFIIHY